jgi:hypothetical protein
LNEPHFCGWNLSLSICRVDNCMFSYIKGRDRLSLCTNSSSIITCAGTRNNFRRVSSTPTVYLFSWWSTNRHVTYIELFPTQNCGYLLDIGSLLTSTTSWVSWGKSISCRRSCR